MFYRPLALLFCFQKFITLEQLEQLEHDNPWY